MEKINKNLGILLIALGMILILLIGSFIWLYSDKDNKKIISDEEDNFVVRYIEKDCAYNAKVVPIKSNGSSVNPFPNTDYLDDFVSPPYDSTL